MMCLWTVFISMLCACAHAKLNPRDLGHIAVHVETGLMEKTYPPSADDNIATSNFRVVLEEIRPFFPVGLGSIPPLDPYFRLTPIVTNIVREDFDCEITLANILVTGGQQFELAASQIYLASVRLDQKVVIPELQVSMHYGVKLHSDEANIDFEGVANATLKHVVADIAMSFKVTGLGPAHILVAGTNVNVTVDDVQYDLKNALRHRRSVPASKLTRAIVQDIKNDVATAIVRAISIDINRLLSNYTFDQIMHILLPNRKN